MRTPSLVLAAKLPNFLSLFSNEAALVGNTRTEKDSEKFHMILFVCVYTQSEASTRVMRKWPDRYFGEGHCQI